MYMLQRRILPRMSPYNKRTLNECTISYGSAHKNIKLDVSKFRYYLHGETPMSNFHLVYTIYIVWNNEYPNRIL